MRARAAPHGRRNTSCTASAAAPSNTSLLAGANSKRYTLTTSDVDHRIRVTVTASNSSGEQQHDLRGHRGHPCGRQRTAKHGAAGDRRLPEPERRGGREPCCGRRRGRADVQRHGRGWAAVTFTPTRRLPLRRRTFLVAFVRARKPGDDVLAGVSGRRLVQATIR